jgi:hypothetical protein
MLALEKVLLAGANYYRPTNQGQQEFTTPGTYTFVVPPNVQSISMVAVGGGGGGAQNVEDGGGGGGGALAYNNDVAVTPGETLTVVVGLGGSRGDGQGTAGAQSSVTRASTASQVYDNFETIGALGSKWISSQGVAVRTWGDGIGGYPFVGFSSSGISGSSAYLAFNSDTALRQAITQPQDLTHATKLKIRYIYGNGSNGGEQVDPGEYLGIAFSTDNSTYTDIIYPFSLVYTWTDGEIAIPSQWKRPGVYIKLYQPSSSGAGFDNIGIDNFTIEYGNRLLVAAGGGQPAVGVRGGNGGVPAGSTSDQYSSSVVLLLTGDGIDGSRNFVDSSPNPKTILSFNDLNGQGYPLQTTRFKKFGSGSIDFNGVSSFYAQASNTDFVLGGDFTIEGWLWVNNENQAGYQTIWELNDYRNGILFRFGSSNDNFYVNGVLRINRIVPYFPPLQWNHFAVVRSGSTITVYANGSSIGSFTESGVINSASGPIRFGESNHTGYQFSPPMYLDEFRITKGVARYTGNFTPPATSSNDTTSLTNFPGYPGGAGGNGSEYYGNNWFAGGGGGAGGYTSSGGAGGDNMGLGVASTGGGGAGGNSDNLRAFGGGGTGIKGISNNGSGNGGGGSSYNSVTDFISTNINSQVDFYPVTLSWAWGNFINTYGVWYDNGTYTRGWYAPYTGTYTMEYTADNYIEVSVDGRLVGVESNFGSSSISTFTASQGVVTLSFAVANYGGPAGFAVTIRDKNGTLLWDTRTYASKNAINLAIRSVAAGTAGTQADGGFPGGGGGGHDAGQTAGNGGGGAVRIIWGKGRNYPYNAKDVTPVATATIVGLILHYDAESAASYSGGSTVYDISGNNNHGTISLGYIPATVPGLGSNKVIRFSASANTKIDFNANELTSSTITVEMWALAYSFAGGMFFGWYAHDVYTRDGTLGYNTGNGDIYGISAARINSLNVTGRWTHYVFVMNAGDYNGNKIYINGNPETLSQQYSSQYTPYLGFNSGVGRIGGWRYDNNYQQVMDVGVFKIYNRELTQVEINTNYNERRSQYSTPVFYAGLWGKRVDGYFNDDVNFFAGRTVVESRAFQDLSGFSSYRDQYSWEFTGYFQPPYDGTYTIGMGSDDASYLWIGSIAVSGYTTGNPLINNGGLHGYQTVVGQINLLAGVYYPIRIQFGENYGADSIAVAILGPQYMGLWGNGYFFHDDTNKI